MHRNRLIALAGVIIGIIGLFMKSLTTDGESLMRALREGDRSFPGGIPTIWGALASWAQVLVVILILVVVVLAIRPDIRKGLDRTSSLIVAGVGVALLAYAVVKFLDAGDKAERLAGAFGQAFSAGAIPEAYAVSRGVGFVVLIIGTVLVTFAGAMGFIGDDGK